MPSGLRRVQFHVLDFGRTQYERRPFNRRAFCGRITREIPQNLWPLGGKGLLKKTLCGHRGPAKGAGRASRKNHHGATGGNSPGGAKASLGENISFEILKILPWDF